VNEDSPRSSSKEHNCPEAARFALSRPRNPLLYDPGTQIGIDKSPLRTLHCVEKAGIIDATATSEPLEALALEHSHR
jgi:hypothetical protein